MDGAETINNERLLVYYMFIVAKSLRLLFLSHEGLNKSLSTYFMSCLYFKMFIIMQVIEISSQSISQFK